MKRLVFRLLYISGIVRLAAWLNRRRVMVLCYHGVTERTVRHPKDHFGLHVRHNRFVQHLEYLQRRYQVIPLKDYLTARREGQSFPNYSVVITFDDGYRNFLTAAAPRLLASGMTASMFLITDRIRNGLAATEGKWIEHDDETYLSWGDIQNLRQRGFEFGSHTCSHTELPKLSPAEIEHELRASKTVLTNQLKMKSMPLAYPYGLASDGIAAKAEALGYICAFTTDAGFNDEETNLFMLHRTLIGDDDDLTGFAARVSGLTRLLSQGMARG